MTERDFESYLEQALFYYNSGDEMNVDNGRPRIVECRTFKEGGDLTDKKGFIIAMYGGSTFQVSITKIS